MNKIKDYLPFIVGTGCGSLLNWFIYKDLQTVVVGALGAFLFLLIGLIYIKLKKRK